jgi:hypothetical protein
MAGETIGQPASPNDPEVSHANLVPSSEGSEPTDPFRLPDAISQITPKDLLPGDLIAHPVGNYGTAYYQVTGPTAVSPGKYTLGSSIIAGKPTGGITSDGSTRTTELVRIKRLTAPVGPFDALDQPSELPKTTALDLLLLGDDQSYTLTTCYLDHFPDIAGYKLETPDNDTATFETINTDKIGDHLVAYRADSLENYIELRALIGVLGKERISEFDEDKVAAYAQALAKAHDLLSSAQNRSDLVEVPNGIVRLNWLSDGSPDFTAHLVGSGQEKYEKLELNLDPRANINHASIEEDFRSSSPSEARRAANNMTRDFPLTALHIRGYPNNERQQLQTASALIALNRLGAALAAGLVAEAYNQNDLPNPFLYKIVR